MGCIFAATAQARHSCLSVILCPMDKKEINSPKLTARFVMFITGFVLLMLVVAHYFLKWF
jgi:hypothetical protein